MLADEEHKKIWLWFRISFGIQFDWSECSSKWREKWNAEREINEIQIHRNIKIFDLKEIGPMEFVKNLFRRNIGEDINTTKFCRFTFVTISFNRAWTVSIIGIKECSKILKIDFNHAYLMIFKVGFVKLRYYTGSVSCTW